MAQDDDDDDQYDAPILPFLLSRTSPRGTAGGFADLGVGPMAHRLGMRDSQMTGH